MQAFLYEELGGLAGLIIVIAVAIILAKAFYTRPKL